MQWHVSNAQFWPTLRFWASRVMCWCNCLLASLLSLVSVITIFVLWVTVRRRWECWDLISSIISITKLSRSNVLQHRVRVVLWPVVGLKPPATHYFLYYLCPGHDIKLQGGGGGVMTNMWGTQPHKYKKSPAILCCVFASLLSLVSVSTRFE